MLPSPNAQAILKRFQPKMVTCKPVVKKARIQLDFSNQPPAEPGVYVVYLRSNGMAFYVGEASHLLRRLTYLFRCHRNDNPHPCHRRHEEVWDELPDCEDFCAKYGVRWFSTKGMFGRLEAEEALISQLGTNKKDFYLNIEQRMVMHTEGGLVHARRKTTVCCAGKTCGKFCPVWRELMTNPAYQSAGGYVVPTLTGKKANLAVRVQPNQKLPVNVHRPGTTLNFDFDEADCMAICQRYEEGLRQGLDFRKGGTSFFNQPKWSNPSLGMINTPFAAAVIRHARHRIGLP